MRRTKLVLAAAAVMVAMLVAFSAPAMANDKNERNDQQSFSNISGNNHDRFFDNDDCCNNNNDDDAIILTSFGGHGEDFFDHGIDDGNNFSAFSPFFGLGCWEWSWVFEEWEWEEDCD
jgi:hypothetical protein